MANTQLYTETILFNLPLPQFLQSFKNTILQSIIPKLNTIIQDLQNKQTNNSIVTLLCIIIIFMLLKQIIHGVFRLRNKPQLIKIVSQVEIDAEIRSLANQIKNLKNTLKRIINQSNNAGKDGTNNQQKQKEVITRQANNIEDGNNLVNVQQVNKLMQYFQQSAQEYSNLAQYILNSQELIFVQLKNVKKLRGYTEKTSSHGSRDQSAGYQAIQIPRQTGQTKNLQQQMKQPVLEQQTQKPIIEQTKQQILEPPVKTEFVVRSVKPILPPPGAKRRVVPPPPIK